jgi:hypothetical protein
MTEAVYSLSSACEVRECPENLGKSHTAVYIAWIRWTDEECLIELDHVIIQLYSSHARQEV